MSVLSEYYVKDYTRIILERIRDTQTLLNKSFVSVMFKGLYEYDEDTGTWTLRKKIVLPALAGSLFMDQEEIIGLGMWADQENHGLHDQPLFKIDIWARNPLELHNIYSTVRKIMFQNIRYFQSKGIKNCVLYRTTAMQYDAGDRIMQGSSHVNTQVQRLVMLYRLDIQQVFSPAQEGLGLIGTIEFEDTGSGETVQWKVGGGFVDPLTVDLFGIFEDYIDLGVW